MMIGVIICVFLFTILYYVTRNRHTSSLIGSHVVVTGGSSGIGLALATQARKEGANVTIVARDPKKLDEAKSKLEAVDGTSDSWVNTVSLDVTSNWEEVNERMQGLVNSHGPVQSLFNCAGFSVAYYFEDADKASYERLMQVNFMGAVAITRALLPHMRKHTSRPMATCGTICFVSSMAGQLGIFGYTGYSASKFALRGFAESLYQEVLEDNISVTLAFPPDTDTPGFKAEQIGKPAETQAISELGGLVSPETVAKKIISDTLSHSFFSSLGFDGWLLTTMTTGMAPTQSFLQAFFRAFMSFPVLMIGFSYRLWIHYVIRKSSTKAAREKVLRASKVE